MIMQTKSITDWQLMHLTGFLLTDIHASGEVTERVDAARLAEFCGVTERAVRNWKHKGLPKRARTQLENLYDGAYLPASWRRAGIRVLHDGVLLRCGSHISIDVINYWKFIVSGVDWGRVQDIQNMLNTNLLTGRRMPYEFVQSGVAAAKKLTAAAQQRLQAY